MLRLLVVTLYTCKQILCFLNMNVNVRIHSLKRLSNLEKEKDVLFSVRLAVATSLFGTNHAPLFTVRGRADGADRRSLIRSRR